jgi:hypothetical protein
MSIGPLFNFSDPRLIFTFLGQGLPVLARQGVYHHIGPQPSVEAATESSNRYVADLRNDALDNNGHNIQLA